MQLLFIRLNGSEFDVVIIPISPSAPMLLTRNLLYTAVTRAKQLVVIVGNLAVVNKMIDNTYEQRRYTTFKDRIMEMAAESESQEYMSLYDEDIEWDGLRDE